MKKVIIIVVAIIIIILGIYLFVGNKNEATNDNQEQGMVENNVTPQTPAQPVAPQIDETKTVIGKSVEGRDIVAFHYGSGSKEVLLVGGIHGGYAWNTSALAYELMNNFEANKNTIPESIKVSIIPALNPDGLYKIVQKEGAFSSSEVKMTLEQTIPGRFNANNVDLNRNFDCDWAPTGKWQTRTVSGGSSAFSEPESVAVKNYIESKKPVAVVVFDSAAGGVYASSCGNGVSTQTTNLTNTFANASGYKAYNDFNFYEINGDMVNWLAKIGTPAINVLLTNHGQTEFAKNLAGVKAVLNAVK